MPISAQVPNVRPQAEGGHSGDQPGEGPHVQEAEDCLQVAEYCYQYHIILNQYRFQYHIKLNHL